MDFLQLNYFLEVARMGNMTAAANSLHVAQSSVSRSIARLEADLGVPLFERSGRGIFLNDYGKAFYARAETILRELDEGERELREMRDQYTGRISIATNAARQINVLMMQFVRDHPEALFRQRRLTDLQEIRAKLASGVLDYALTYTPLADAEYLWQPLIREEYFLLIPAGHPLCQSDTASVEDLRGERLLLSDADDPDFVEEQCLKHGFSPTFSFISNEYEVLGPMVERGLGIATMTTLSVYDMRKNLPLEVLGRNELVKIADSSFQRTLGILSRKHHYLSPAARIFYRSLLDYFKVIEIEMEPS